MRRDERHRRATSQQDLVKPEYISFGSKKELVKVLIDTMEND